MQHRRLILLFVLFAQAILLMYSNHVRSVMLKTMNDQNNALKQAIQAMDLQGRVIKYQSRVIEKMRRECDTTQNRVAYQ